MQPDGDTPRLEILLEVKSAVESAYSRESRVDEPHAAFGLVLNDVSLRNDVTYHHVRSYHDCTPGL